MKAFETMKPTSYGTLVLGSAALVAATLVACSAEPPATSPGSGGQGGAGGLGGSAGIGGGSGVSGAGGTAGSSGGVGGSAGSTVGGAGGSVAGAGAGGALGGAGASGGLSGTAGQGATSGAGGGGLAGSGSGASGASGAAGSGTPGNCVFTVESQTADKAGQGGIPTVGIVTWSVDLPNLTSASIAFSLEGGTAMTAPVDLTQMPNYRTLLLGMKGSKTYNFQITASNGTTTCSSMSYPITTGAVPSAVPRIMRTTGPAAASQKRGFIVTSTGFGGGGGSRAAYAFIIDADGEPVWWAPGPADCTRAKMSHDGQHMWMLTLNVTNGQNNGGAVDRVSMDGLTRNTKIPNLSNCHHDLTVNTDNKVVCPSWVMQSGDQPSNLIESDAEGNVTTIVRLDGMVYAGGPSAIGGGSASFHANAVHYHPSDDTYTVSDRNPSMVVKVNRQGQALWQVGGSCTNAPADGCVGASWRVNHGHDLLEDGSLLIFNNGQSGASAALNYSLNTQGTFTATQDWSYNPGTTSNVLGDVQWLPEGNVLVTFSTAGLIQEIDASRAIVQSINVGTVGYSDWRPTLYGPPARY